MCLCDLAFVWENMTAQQKSLIFAENFDAAITCPSIPSLNAKYLHGYKATQSFETHIRKIVS